MRLEPIVYSGLLIAALAGAFWASMPSQNTDSNKTSIFSLEPKLVAEVQYTKPDLELAVSRNEAGQFWVSSKKTLSLPAGHPKPEGDAQTATAEPAPQVVTERFLGSERVSEALKAFNPFEVLRVIGKVDDKQLGEYGLQNKAETFTIKGSDGKQLTLYLGKKSYGGSNRFALDNDGRVLLVEDRVFEDLERAKLRLYESRLMSADVDSINKVQITAKGGSKNLAQIASDKMEDLQWADDEANAQPKPAYKSWIDKIVRLRSTAYASAEQEQALAAAEPFLTIVFEKNGKPLDKLIFKKESADKPTYWATSDFLKAHVKLADNQVMAVEADIATILAK